MIVLSHIKKAFGDKVVLSDLSLTIADGEKIAIRGESGKGKTTLLRIIARLEKPTGGEISGYDPADIAYMFQEPRLFENLSVWENVAVVCPDYPKSAAKEKASSYLARVGLDTDSDKYPSALSGGMKQRAALARALCAEKKILLLDEPFSALDRETKREMLTLVKEYTQTRTLILVTHTQEDADFLCDKELVF